MSHLLSPQGIEQGLLSITINMTILGVVVPTLTPTVSTIVSEVGGSLMLALISGDEQIGKELDEEKTFVTLFLWSVAMVVINSLVSLAGLYNIFH